MTSIIHDYPAIAARMLGELKPAPKPPEPEPTLGSVLAEDKLLTYNRATRDLP